MLKEEVKNTAPWQQKLIFAVKKQKCESDSRPGHEIFLMDEHYNLEENMADKDNEKMKNRKADKEQKGKISPDWHNPKEWPMAHL